MKIGSIKISPPLFFAPLAGYSDKPTRKISKNFGAEAVFTEFVSSEGLIRKNDKTEEYLNFDQDERPIGIQIFGHRIKAMKEAAEYLEERYSPDIIDINYGCSVKKVTKKGAGAALLKDQDKAIEMARAMVKSVNTPITAKIRAGWDTDSIIATEFSKSLENAGVSAITIHPRTAKDGFNNTPNYDIIKKMKSEVDIPIIGNGDLDSVEKVKEVKNYTNCDGIMIGRWVIGNPWLFREVRNYLVDKDYQEPKICPTKKIELCKYHLSQQANYRGKEKANKIMKKFYSYYFKEYYNASKIRGELVESDNIKETFQILENYMEQYKEVYTKS